MYFCQNWQDFKGLTDRVPEKRSGQSRDWIPYLSMRPGRGHLLPFQVCDPPLVLAKGIHHVEAVLSIPV